MNSVERKKLQVLIIMLAILGLSLYYNFFSEKPSSIATAASPKKSPEAVSRSEFPASEFRLSLQSSAPADIKRNIFELGQQAAVETPRPETDPTSEETEPSPVITIPEVWYLGFYYEKGHPDTKLAAISNGGKIYVGKVGEVVAERYEILRIEKGFLVLKLVPENTVLRLSLGKKKGKVLDEAPD